MAKHDNLKLWVFLLISEQQFLLNRVADAAIDIYGMVAVLSRASRALENNLESAKLESTMCQVFCDQVVIDRVSTGLFLHDDTLH